MNNLVRLIILFLLPLMVHATGVGTEKRSSMGLGEVAQNLMEPVSLFGDFVDTACLVIGLSFLFAAGVKYIEHRRSPLMVPISTVFFLVIAGLLLIAMPFLYQYTEGGVPYSLLG